MLSAESRRKLATPGLRLPSLKALPLGSRITLGVLAAMVLLALFAPLIARYSPHATGLVPPDQVVYNEIVIEGVGTQRVPDNSVPPSSTFWFGTDDSGRDVFSRIVYGSRVSLIVGLTATGLALVCAAVLGSIAATARK